MGQEIGAVEKEEYHDAVQAGHGQQAQQGEA